MDKLNSDMLLSIFELLSEADLKRAYLVCKSWKSTIDSSTKLSKKFTLIINGRNFWKISALRAKQIPYKNFIFRNFKKEQNSEMESLKKVLNFHKAHIESLIIKKCNSKMLLNFLPIASNLTHLTLVNNQGNLQSDFELDFPNLVSLRLDHDGNFVNYIKSHKLQKLDLYGIHFNETWKNFLMTCVDLKEMFIHSNFYEFYAVENFPFKLTKLVTRLCENISYAGFKKFCLNQKETLKTLQLSGMRETPEIFDFVAFELSVETFNCSFERMSGSLEGKKVNKTIKKFISSLTNFNDYSGNILSSLQAVETLGISFKLKDAEKITGLIETWMPNLKTLNIFVEELFNADERKVCKIPQVKKLSVKLSNDDQDFCDGHWAKYKILCQKNFYTLCPSVEKLEILEDFLPITPEVLKTLLQSNQNIEEIFCNENLKFDNDCVDLILKSKIRKIIIEKYEEKSQKIPEKLKESKINFIVREREIKKYDEFLASDESDDESDEEEEIDDDEDEENDEEFDLGFGADLHLINFILNFRQ